MFNINDYKHVFSKYYLNIKNPKNDIDYQVLYESIAFTEHNFLENILSIHCYNIENINNFFLKIISKYLNDHHLIITFSNSNNEIEKNLIKSIKSLSLIKITNIGADISNKLISISYLLDKHPSMYFKYILFIHSKSNIIDRNNNIEPFYNNHYIIRNLIDNNIDMIIPNYHNIRAKNNLSVVNGMDIELKELFNFFKINTKISDIEFNATNTMVLSYRYCKSLQPYLKLLYNHLNQDNDFDNQWYKLAYNSEKTIEKNYEEFKNKNRLGNSWYSRNLDGPLPDNGSYEHLFERFWLEYCKSKNYNYFSLPENINNFYNIKLYPIYFPQFHNSKENNKIWGEGFTEWTLLKPYPENIVIDNNHISILKPSDDLGYYSLDSIEIINKQIDIAKKYGINGFMIYHYWFGNNHSVLNRVEKHIIDGNFNFPFYLCWANEPWTQQWEGGGNDKCFIRQDYEDNNNLEHINYLINFFNNPNYVKNSKGECIFYIYNFKDIEKKIDNILSKWSNELIKHNIKIQIITTSNAEPYNQNNGSPIKHLFLPACSSQKYWDGCPETKAYNDEKIFKNIPWYISCDYLNLIKYYQELLFNNDHICIPLNWNNIIRKKNKPHLQMKNFNKENLEIMVRLVITKVLLRNKNKIVFEDIKKYNIKGDNNFEDLYLDNIITVNAWNEWNEQAILEPNNITGYENLEIISKYF